MFVSSACEPVDADDHDDDKDAHEDHVHEIHLVGGQASPGHGALVARVHYWQRETRARAGLKPLTLVTRGHVLALALTRVTMPRVPRAVDTPELVRPQPRQTLTRARVLSPVMSGRAGGSCLVTLAPTRAPVMLQLYAGAVGRAVHVDNHRVRLQLGLLRGAARAQAVQTQTSNGKRL